MRGMHDPDAAPEANDLARSISHALWQTDLRVDRAADIWLAPLGLSDSVLGSLAWIARQPGLSAAELARRSGTRPQSVARAVGRLEDLGLVARAPHPVHGKVVEIRLTDRGREALAVGATRFAAFEAALERDVTPEERELLIGLLDRLRKRADELARLGPPKPNGRGGRDESARRDVREARSRGAREDRRVDRRTRSS